MADAHVGTAGFNYKHWRGEFYPEGVPQRAWFDFYAERFATVELNVTFYRLVKRAAVEGWVERAPAGFRFVAKGSRYITHMKRFKDPREPLRRFFEPLAPMAEQLDVVLWQTPPHVQANVERLRSFLSALEKAPAPEGVRHAFEFRHASWFDEAVYGALRDARAALALADYPFHVLVKGMARPTSDLPRIEVPLTTDLVYMRRHGTRGPYNGAYTKGMVGQDAKAIRGWLESGREVYAFYNNDIGGHAVRDAAALREAVDTE